MPDPDPLSDIQKARKVLASIRPGRKKKQ